MPTLAQSEDCGGSHSDPQRCASKDCASNKRPSCRKGCNASVRWDGLSCVGVTFMEPVVEMCVLIAAGDVKTRRPVVDDSPVLQSSGSSNVCAHAGKPNGFVEINVPVQTLEAGSLGVCDPIIEGVKVLCCSDMVKLENGTLKVLALLVPDGPKLDAVRGTCGLNSDTDAVVALALPWFETSSVVLAVAVHPVAAPEASWPVINTVPVTLGSVKESLEVLLGSGAVDVEVGVPQVSVSPSLFPPNDQLLLSALCESLIDAPPGAKMPWVATKKANDSSNDIVRELELGKYSKDGFRLGARSYHSHSRNVSERRVKRVPLKAVVMKYPANMVRATPRRLPSLNASLQQYWIPAGVA